MYIHKSEVTVHPDHVPVQLLGGRGESEIIMKKAKTDSSFQPAKKNSLPRTPCTHPPQPRPAAPPHTHTTSQPGLPPSRTNENFNDKTHYPYYSNNSFLLPFPCVSFCSYFIRKYIILIIRKPQKTLTSK